MVFNSWIFLIFFVCVFLLYRVLGHKLQNRMLLIASYIFYGSWDWRFLSLVLLSTLIDYFCGLRIHNTENTRLRQVFLWCSVAGNLSILGIFKYFNFFAGSLQSLAVLFGFELDVPTLKLILPVGISFYTFQTMSYTIDIYRKQLSPTRNFFDFALYVCFFPQLMAGPIERAKDLMPQITSPRRVTLEKFYEGCYLMGWGLFQKVFAADNLGKIADYHFSMSLDNGFFILIGMYAFTMQIFCDFAGYSNIARGLAKCMGFELSVNFRFPYFSTNPVQYWKRWHITLYSWMRDYVYIPLTFGGNQKRSVSVAHQSTIIVMLLGGLWHGAGWSYILWGAYHGAWLVLYRFAQPLLDRIRFRLGALAGKIWTIICWFTFFQVLSISKLLFRSESLSHFFAMVQALFLKFSVTDSRPSLLGYVIFYSFIVLVVQFCQFRSKDLMVVYKSNILVRCLFYLVCLYLVIIFGVTQELPFIYFQF